MKMAAIYARVSSEQQREEHTIASQTAALIEFARSHDLQVPKEWVFEDEVGISDHRDRSFRHRDRSFRERDRRFRRNVTDVSEP